MAGKKRSGGESSDEVENNSLANVPAKKKPKNGRRKTGERSDSGDANSQAAAPPGVASYAKDMEKKKKRKALDKGRKRTALEKEGIAPQAGAVVLNSKSDENGKSVASPSSSTGGLPDLPLNYFRELASADISVRKTAAESLVLRLQDIQTQYETLPDKDSVSDGLMLEAERNDGLDDCAPHLRYTLRRLIRGVSSSRECARQGFALGLTLLVGAISSIKAESLMKLIVDALAVSSSMKGQDVKECLLGRLFAYGALARSGRLNKDWLHDKYTPIIKEFTNAVISLAGKKRYLQEPAVHVLLDIVEKLPAEALLNHVAEAQELRNWFEQATYVGNPDALLLALKLREKISVDHPVFGKLLPVPFSSANLFSADHLSSIANCLKESTFCQPRVHSLWPVIVDRLLPETVHTEDATSISKPSKKAKRTGKSSPIEEEMTKNIQNFCEIIIEGTLLSSSHDRKHLAFDILLLLLPKLRASFVPSVLSYKFVQCLMDILSTKDSWMHKVAQYFIKELLDWLRNDDDYYDARRAAVTMAFQRHSLGKFDIITRTKTIKDLTSEFETEDGCRFFLQNLMDLFVDEKHVPEEPSDMEWALEPCSLNSDQSQTTDDNSEIDSKEEESVGTAENSDLLKSWVIQSLLRILKDADMGPISTYRLKQHILKFLVVQGLFRASLGTEVTSFELQEKFKWPKTATSTALCKMCIEQLQLLLSHSQKSVDSLPKDIVRELDGLASYFMKFLSTLQNIPSISLFCSLNEADEKAVRDLQETERKLSREERYYGLFDDARKSHAMKLLAVQLLLQVLLHPGEFSEAAYELAICCDKAFDDLLKGFGEGEADDEAPEVIDVLVDTLLTLLPQTSAPMRSAIEEVFKCFCHDVTNNGLLRMLRVIKKDLKPARHQDPESDLDDDDGEDCLAIEEEENEDIDEAETGETGESDEQMDDSEAVIGIQNADKGFNENSDDSESDEGMDDDAMFRMDTYLAQIFREKKNQAGGETAQSQLVLFKLRVLSLLEIYLHENPGHPQVLTVYSNLAQALVNPNTSESSEQLVQRIWSIVQKRILKAKEFPKDESIQLSTLVSLLEKNLKLAAKPFKRKKFGTNPPKKKQSAAWNRYKMVSNLAQNSTYWILKIIDARKFSESELQEILDVFQSALVGYFDTKKSHIKVEFLEEVFRRRPWIGHRLFGFLLDKCQNAKMEFRRIEALDLVAETMRSLAPLKSRDEQQTNEEASSKAMKTHLQKLSQLMKVLVLKMPEKQARRSLVRKCCHRIFQTVSKLKLTKSFLKKLGPDGQSACESSISDLFLEFKNA
ncbi:PREDICTED: DNA polymerase V-like [Tarenaya hassleriana]|uniref:DNA polymerase V-like n=1 Tax=Tarenaya hassleriana TaxID=28532 RepID=UPI00053C3C86|nr:PREDICTED: DNA polymerase V-like [Tarenaya hassleriana]